LAKIAKEHDLYIIADEVYREFCYDGKEAASFSTLEGVKDRVIIVDSVSKRFSACGARIGCIASKNKDVMLGALKMAQGRLSSPTLEMIGAKALYDLEPNYFDPIRERYQRRRDVMVDAMQKMEGVLIKRPSGAFYAIASLPVDNAEKFAIWMLSEFEQDGKTVMVAPVENFYATQNMGLNEARVAYVLNEDDLVEAMKVLEAGLKAYPGRTI
ncbi:MAG: aminotransferase class I/II-fold pyridoxal phosphate-dependent enzyme, partial [Eubacteriales bacterium]|nr:aminotransferase class I/II-fold pyridoxal phosphate-dependent enzyme [Eubacteriales bacterium]